MPSQFAAGPTMPEIVSSPQANRATALNFAPGSTKANKKALLGSHHADFPAYNTMRRESDNAASSGTLFKPGVQSGPMRATSDLRPP